MSLIDEFRKLAGDIPPSHVPSLNELAQVVGASVLYAEHGDSLLKAAESGAEGIAKLLAPEAAAIADAAAPEASPLINEGERLIEELPPVEHDQAAAPVEPTALDPTSPVSPADSAAPVTDTSEAAPEQTEQTSDAQTIAELRSQLQAAQVDLANARATQVSSGEGQG